MNGPAPEASDNRKFRLSIFQRRVIKLMLFHFALVFISFPIVMSTLAPYDDEGYVMMTLRTFIDGAPLYSSTHTQYGPAYYFLSGALHSVFGLPLNQDWVRLKTIVFWCTSTVLCYAVLRRLCVAEPLRTITALLFHVHLNKLSLEPGHPQEWILVLSMLTIWFVTGSSRSRWAMAAGCVGLIGMIKLNCGAVMAIPLILEAFVASRDESSNPVEKSKNPCFGILSYRSALIAVLFTGSMVAFVISCLAILSGTRLHDLAWGLVGQHRRFTIEFYHSIPLNRFALVLAVAAIISCLPVFRRYRNRVFLGIGIVAYAGAVLTILNDFWRPLMHGLESRGATSWLVLAGPAMLPLLWVRTRKHLPSPMVFLVSLVCLAPAIAYPTPGTQLSLATAFAWIPMAICLQQSILAQSPTVAPRALVRSAGIVTLLILAMSVTPWIRWAINEPLIGEGVRLMRLDPPLAKKENAVTQAILDTNSAYLTFDGHNHNRFYFRTGLRPLTSANPTFWPRMLTDAEQSRLIERIRECNSMCVVIPSESDALAGGYASLVRREMHRSVSKRLVVDDWQVGSNHFD
ncbi:MAG: hypothetical protein ACK56W_14360 [Pirellula sp.]|jgi:hypothetical protein|nr:hypothetical protein [Pirellula sp.]